MGVHCPAPIQTQFLVLLTDLLAHPIVTNKDTGYDLIPQAFVKTTFVAQHSLLERQFPHVMKKRENCEPHRCSEAKPVCLHLVLSSALHVL